LRGSRIGSDPQPAIAAPAEMLGEMAVQAWGDYADWLVVDDDLDF
jgi:hypothetical protein